MAESARVLELMVRWFKPKQSKQRAVLIKINQDSLQDTPLRLS